MNAASPKKDDFMPKPVEHHQNPEPVERKHDEREVADNGNKDSFVSGDAHEPRQHE